MPVLVNPYVSYPAATGPFFYVDPAGDDGNPGSEAAPWQTFTFAATQLGPGDTLIAAGGTYHESDIGISADGTADEPITIQAAEGETPIIDGSLAAYRTSGNSAWENVSGNLYRTVATLASPGDFGYTGRIDVGGTLYLLTAYRDNDVDTGLAFLSAVADLFDPANPYYMGPGICHHTDGHVYIRLDPNSSAAQWSAVTPLDIADKDPRNHAIYLAPNNVGIDIAGDFLVIDGIELRHHWNSVSGVGADATIKNLTMRPSRFGARVGAARWTFDNVTMQFDRPSWIARSDVKSFPEPGKDTRTGGIDWQGTVGGQFINGSIIGAFDGMLVLSNEHDLTVLNSVFADCFDDGVQMGSAAYDMEYGYNTFTGSGISHDGSGSDASNTPDSVYVHHNVFDNTSTIFWARKPAIGVDPPDNGDGGYLCPHIFGSHGVPDFDDPWKIYNNTIVHVSAPGAVGVNQYMYHGDAAGTGIHEVYNNLINYGDVCRVYRNVRANTGLEAYDYNIYARVTPLDQFAIESVDAGGTSRAVTSDFATWKSQMAFDTHSVERTTPVSLDGSYRPAVAGPADGTGVDLSAKGWPGTSPGTTYIGAKAPV